MVISVPLIIEKIIKKNVMPKLATHSMKLMLRVPVLSDKILHKVREQIQAVFGGEFYEVVIGGAALNKEVEQFLQKINFNYTVATAPRNALRSSPTKTGKNSYRVRAVRWFPAWNCA